MLSTVLAGILAVSGLVQVSDTTIAVERGVRLQRQGRDWHHHR